MFLYARGPRPRAQSLSRAKRTQSRKKQGMVRARIKSFASVLALNENRANENKNSGHQAAKPVVIELFRSKSTYFDVKGL